MPQAQRAGRLLQLERNADLVDGRGRRRPEQRHRDPGRSALQLLGVARHGERDHRCIGQAALHRDTDNALPLIGGDAECQEVAFIAAERERRGRDQRHLAVYSGQVDMAGPGHKRAR